ncbi:MAG: hypothetical protein KAJ47_01175 [Candidatus Aenigmarchaeota archaeon]|nr:hypothetical protein [Candidatus Aenigmarchaeota archaeon]
MDEIKEINKMIKGVDREIQKESDGMTAGGIIPSPNPTIIVRPASSPTEKQNYLPETDKQNYNPIYDLYESGIEEQNIAKTGGPIRDEYLAFIGNTAFGNEHKNKIIK